MLGRTTVRPVPNAKVVKILIHSAAWIEFFPLYIALLSLYSPGVMPVSFLKKVPNCAALLKPSSF